MSPTDVDHWEQARAWLTLGNVQECLDALERIAPEERACELMAKAITNGGNPVKLDALDDPNAAGLWR